MPPVTISTLPLYIIPLGILLATIIILYRRKWVARFPAFFTLICFVVLRDIVSLPLAAWYTKTRAHAVYKTYFYLFWYCEAIESILVVIVLYRVFEQSFSRYDLLRRWTSVLFMLAIVFCLILAIIVTPENIQGHGVVTLVFPLWQATLLMRAGILGFLFLVVFGIGIGLRDYLFGIAAGFALNACIILAATISKSHLVWASYANTISGFVASIIWFVYLFVPRQKALIESDLSDGHEELARWKDLLSEFLHRWLRSA
jgi:hypothetical protein